MLWNVAVCIIALRFFVAFHWYHVFYCTRLFIYALQCYDASSLTKTCACTMCVIVLMNGQFGTVSRHWNINCKLNETSCCSVVCLCFFYFISFLLLLLWHIYIRVVRACVRANESWSTGYLCTYFFFMCVFFFSSFSSFWFLWIENKSCFTSQLKKSHAEWTLVCKCERVKFTKSHLFETKSHAIDDNWMKWRLIIAVAKMQYCIMGG